MLINNFLCGAASLATTNQSNERVHESLLIPHFERPPPIPVTIINIGTAPVAGGGAPDNLDYAGPYGGIATLSATYLPLLITPRYAPDKF